MSICKKHPLESTVGVCAACLHDRLLSLDSCVSPRCPPPSLNYHQLKPQHRSSSPLFFRVVDTPPTTKLPPKKGSFSVLSTLFATPGRGRACSSRDHCSSARMDNVHLSSTMRPPLEAAVSPSFSSCLAVLFAVRCRGKSAGGLVRTDPGAGSGGPSSADPSDKKVEFKSAPGPRPTCRFLKYRGMSPGSEQEEERGNAEEHRDEEDRAAASSSSPSGVSGSSKDVSALAAPTGTGRNIRRRRRDAAELIAGFAVCFSPLVRTRPHHPRRIGAVAGDCGVGYYGQLQKPAGFRLRRHGHPHQLQRHRLRHGRQGGGVKQCPNRSRKLVNLGRFR